MGAPIRAPPASPAVGRVKLEGTGGCTRDSTAPSTRLPRVRRLPLQVRSPVASPSPAGTPRQLACRIVAARRPQTDFKIRVGEDCRRLSSQTWARALVVFK